MQAVQPDLSNFEAAEISAWPLILDEFVEHMRQQWRQGDQDMTAQPASP